MVAYSAAEKVVDLAVKLVFLLVVDSAAEKVVDLAAKLVFLLVVDSALIQAEKKVVY
jgi:hypothetical protein